MIRLSWYVLAIVLSAVLLNPGPAAGRPEIFPAPREFQATGEWFALDGRVVVEGDPRFARVLGLRSGASRAGERVIRAGTVANPAIRGRAARLGLAVPQTAEGYALYVGAKEVLVAGRDEAGAFYGVQSLRQLTDRRGRRIAGARVRDWPAKPFRGIKLYLPGRDNIGFARRFIADFAAACKYNKLIIELNAGMRFDRHPELNEGWIEFARNMIGTRRNRPSGPHLEFQDSTHYDTADGGVLEKSEVADLVRWARDNHLEVIPEIPSLTHSYYLLTRHRELAENPDFEWPDAYCPSLEGSYKLLFDVLDEYIEVMRPATIHVGHDEWRASWGLCPRCQTQHYGDLYGRDLLRIHDYLKARGIRTAIWGDHLIEPLRGAGPQTFTTESGYKHQRPGALTPEQVKRWIPRDVLIFNWFWDDGQKGQGEEDDAMLAGWGFEQVYGNMEPYIPNYERRSGRRGVLGGAPSSWAATTEFNFGKDLVYTFAGCAEMLWTGTQSAGDRLLARVQSMMPWVRRAFTGEDPPSADAEAARSPASAGGAVAIGVDASSLIFRHASLKPAGKMFSYWLMYDPADTADLLGWYEVVYEDGFITTVPIRYRWNIMEASRPAEYYCYLADPVQEGGKTWWAFEWRNPRLGKAIREVRLRQAQGTRGNEVLLGGIRVVKAR